MESAYTAAPLDSLLCTTDEAENGCIELPHLPPPYLLKSVHASSDTRYTVHNDTTTLEEIDSVGGEGGRMVGGGRGDVKGVITCEEW